MEKIATTELLEKELDEIIQKQLSLIENGASTDNLAENTIRFNELSQKVLNNNDIESKRKAIMLSKISVYANAFIDGLNRSVKLEKLVNGLDNKYINESDKWTLTSKSDYSDENPEDHKSKK